MVFDLQDCASLPCLRTLAIYVYETSREDSILAAETNRYKMISRVAAGDETGQTTEIRDVNFNTSTDAEGFYIAIRDDSTCVVLQRLIVFYHICSGGPGDLEIRPETIAPPIRRHNRPLEVTAQCVEGASPFGGGEVRLNCNQGGVWSALSISGCSCDPGFNASSDRKSCIGKTSCRPAA